MKKKLLGGLALALLLAGCGNSGDSDKEKRMMERRHIKSASSSRWSILRSTVPERDWRNI